jgi:hypothetical protein
MGIVVMLVLATPHMCVSPLSLSHTHEVEVEERIILEHTKADELLNLFGCSMPMPQRPSCHVVHYLDHATYYIVLQHTSTTSVLLTGKGRERSLYTCSYDIMMQGRWSSRLSNNSFPNPTATP